MILAATLFLAGLLSGLLAGYTRKGASLGAWLPV